MPRKLKNIWRNRRWQGFHEYVDDPRTRLFAALACSQRIEILKLLREGEKCTCDIAPRLRIDISVVSRHLAILKSLGLVESWKEGVNNYYAVVDERIFDILAAASNILKDMAERQRELFDKLR
ncbi:MAG: helix-turn-helix transcriptional regulator [Deltaproteobacteria bacterium]|nr:helix-turn-helix transcriptional regulator [Deltaproteobacteria bacterium]